MPNQRVKLEIFFKSLLLSGTLRLNLQIKDSDFGRLFGLFSIKIQSLNEYI